MDKNDYKVINCPICGRKVGGHNELSKINSIFRCRHCNRRVVFNVETREIEIKNLPPRNTVSGISFI